MVKELKYKKTVYDVEFWKAAWNDRTLSEKQKRYKEPPQWQTIRRHHTYWEHMVFLIWWEGYSVKDAQREAAKDYGKSVETMKKVWKYWKRGEITQFEANAFWLCDVQHLDDAPYPELHPSDTLHPHEYKGKNPLRDSKIENLYPFLDR